MRRSTWFAVGLAVVVAVGLFVAGGAVRAEEEGGQGGPTPQKKLDPPLAKAVVGTWDWTGTGMLEGSSGTITYALGLGDTAVLEDVKGTLKFGEQSMPFAGHGVWKLGDDGTTIKLWWFDNLSPGAEAHEGTVTADGYAIKSDKGAMVLKKTATGLELNMHDGAATLVMKKK
jgi:hypothetical protein